MARSASAPAPLAAYRGNGSAASQSASRTRPRLAGALPGFIKPALATLTDEIPRSGDWLFEVKFDGYRAIAAVSGERARLYTRNGLDWTDRYGPLAGALEDLGLDGALLDGEVVAFDPKGRSDFSSLQNALKAGGRGLSYFVFDLLAEDGQSQRARPLRERKERLRRLLGRAGREGPVFFTDHVENDGGAMLETLCRSGYEGVIAKRADAPYRSGRGRSWLKVKCERRQEMVIVGWSPSARNRPFSSLLLGLWHEGKLVYAGRVGIGFSQSDLVDLDRKLKARARKTPAVEGAIPRPVRRKVHWVTPDLVAEVKFAEFTAQGVIRQARFLGLREDKPAESVTLEAASSNVGSGENPRPDQPESTGDAVIGGVRLSHPDKPLYPQQGITKRALAGYLEAVAARMLPHLENRLLSVVRCPQGTQETCFFQRHRDAGLGAYLRSLDVEKSSGGSREYLYLASKTELISAAQLGILEFHVWGSRIDAVERPDRLVFDLDPDPSVGFEEVKTAAVLMRDSLDALGLRSFPLVTGGKGVHVVAPLTRRHEWPVVKAFAKALAERVVEDDPERYVATMSKAKRKGRIFIDHFRNGRSATAIAPYSPRAREGAPLAWPVSWNELQKLDAAHRFRLGDVDLDAADPWADYPHLRQNLKAASLRAMGISET